MPEEKPDFLVCGLATERNEYPGAITVKCSKCPNVCRVWPAGQKITSDGAAVLCVDCAWPEIRKNGRDVRIHKNTLKELFRFWGRN